MPTVLITGVNRGIGLELARQYLHDGWHVHGTLRQHGDASEALCGRYPETFEVHALDVTEFDAVDRLAGVLATIDIDVLLSSAGTMGNIDFAAGGLDVGGFAQTDYTDWLDVLRVNTLAPMRLAEAFVEHVARSRQRKIVALTSMVGSMALNTRGGLYAYRSSKAALNAVMRSMSHDLRSRGIIALPLHPGWVRTGMGGPGADIDVESSAAGIRRVIDSVTLADSGRFLRFDGEELPW